MTSRAVWAVAAAAAIAALACLCPASMVNSTAAAQDGSDASDDASPANATPPVRLDADLVEAVQGAQGILTINVTGLVEGAGPVAVQAVFTELTADDGSESRTVGRQDIRFVGTRGVAETFTVELELNETRTVQMRFQSDPELEAGDVLVEFKVEMGNESFTTMDGELPYAHVRITERTPLIPGFEAPLAAAAIAAVIVWRRLR